VNRHRIARRAHGRMGGRHAIGLLLALLPASLAAARASVPQSAAPAAVNEPDSLAPATVAAIAPRLWRAGMGVDWLAPPAPGDTLHLSERLVTPGTLRLTCGRTFYRETTHYRFDPLSGEIVWLAARPIAPLHATYRYLPLPLRGSWGDHPDVARPETLAITPRAPRAASALPPGTQLEIGGSKTVSVEFGNRRDARLDQSLDLTLRGQLAPRVQVRAALTDRSTPLQPEGTTTELTDLDQVLIEVTSPWGELHLGDVTVEQTGFAFLAHRRAMEGIDVVAGRAGGRHATGAFGRGVGREAALEFVAIDGKQGPYRLLDPAQGGALPGRMPNENAVIVAGSERIWLDGERLTRGEGDDYTIDYASGELWFTPRRAVTGVSEVRATFQVREGAFDRSYYALAAAVGDTTAGVGVAWTREADDPGASAGAGLTGAERESLRAAGDSRLAVGAGARPDSLGDYVQVESDTLETPFYLYVAGDTLAYAQRYVVAFLDAGDGEGDYAARVSPTGETYYAYVGRRRGRYLPGRRLPLPEARDLIALRAAGAWGRGLALSAEGALSNHDANVLSARDDGDNAGGALALQGGWKLGSLWRGRADALELRFAGRAVSERFSPIEPLDPAFAYRRWNASSDSILDGRDRRGNAELVWRPRARLEVTGGYEALHAPQRFDARAWHAALQRSGELYLKAQLWRDATDEQGLRGRAERRGVTIGHAGGVATEIGFASERRLRGVKGREGGEEYATLDASTRASRWVEGLTLALSGQLRRDYVWDRGARRGGGDRRMIESDASYARGAGFGQLTFVRRELHPEGGGAVTRTDLADWALGYRESEASVGGEWRGRLTAAESRLRAERLRHVGLEAGHYDSLGRYVGRGDYELYYEPGDSSELESRIESVARLTLRPWRGLRLGAAGSPGLQSNLFGRLEAAAPEAIGELMASPGRLIAGSADLRAHTRTLRGDLSWKGPPRTPEPLVRYEDERHRERGAGGLQRERRARDALVELRWTVRRGLGTRLEFATRREREGIVTSVAQAAYDERTTRHLAAEATWTPRPPWTLRLRCETGDERFSPDPVTRVRRGLGGGLTAEPFGIGRVELAVERRWVEGAQPQSSAFVVDRPGWELTCNGTLRPRGVVSGSLSVSVTRDEGRAAVVSGRMEARAYF
jgi:hypothetical protein